MMHQSSLQNIYDLWRREPFPSGSEIGEFDAMHAELAYADAMIAESAIPFITKGQYSAVPQQALRELDDVVVTAKQLMQSETGERAQLAATYRKYAELLLVLWAEIEGAHRGA
jgi:hypothetical protein